MRKIGTIIFFLTLYSSILLNDTVTTIDYYITLILLIVVIVEFFNILMYSLSKKYIKTIIIKSFGEKKLLKKKTFLIDTDNNVFTLLYIDRNYSNIVTNDKKFELTYKKVLKQNIIIHIKKID